MSKKQIIDNNDILLRINELITESKMHQTDFAKHVGIDPSNFSAMLSGNRPIGKNMITRIAMSFDINNEWLKTGIGEKKNIKNDANYLHVDRFLYIPLITVPARAGYLSGYGDSEYIDHLPTYPVIADKSYRGKYRCFEVDGDSMNDGTSQAILDGDVVLGREVKQEYWKDKLHIRDWVFVIIHRTDGILIKRITEHLVEEGIIKCHSLNNYYEDFELSLSDIQELFNVIKIVDRKMRL